MLGTQNPQLRNNLNNHQGYPLKIMCYESNEDRIGKIEETMQQMAAMQRDFLGMICMLHEWNFSLAEAIILLKEEHNGVLRFIASNPIFGDAKTRQSFIDKVSKMESQIDFLQAKQATVRAQFAKMKSDSSIPPPDGAPPN